MKLFNIFIVIIFFYGCSFDNKTGIWKDNSITKDNKNNIFKDFESIETGNIKFFNEIIEAEDNFKFFLTTPIENNSWDDIFYNKNNNYDNFIYSNLNQVQLLSKKF